MIKLIATDLDGTLLNDKKEINNRLYELIPVFKEKGILFAACSGRLYSTLNNNFSKVQGDMILAANNGSVIQYNNYGHIIFESFIKRENIINIIKFAREIGVEIYLCSKNHAHVQNPSEDIKSQFYKHEVPYRILDNLEDINVNICRIGIFRPLGVEKELVNILNERFGEHMTIEESGDYWIDIMDKSANKGNAVKQIQNKFGISEKETMVFGDYYNDISMLKNAYYSFAMENAPEDVKLYANFTAKSNNENGVIKKIEEIIAV